MSGYSLDDANKYLGIRKEITVTGRETFAILNSNTEVKDKSVLDFEGNISRTKTQRTFSACSSGHTIKES